jgi:hypothetical protein
MKKLSLLFALVFAFMSCNCQKSAVKSTSGQSKETTMSQESRLPKLEYEANTRGFYQKITIENKMVTVSSDREAKGKGETTSLSDADLKELAAALQSVKIDDLATFKDPTQKRFYDGAAIANLKVSKDGKDYQTKAFDHGFPPVEIEKLVNKMVSFGKKE